MKKSHWIHQKCTSPLLGTWITALHTARASLECLNKFRIRPIRYPPYSTDLALSDCYLLGKLKGAFAGGEFVPTEELLLAIREVIESIRPAELESVFDTWERRLFQCIQIKGEDISWPESKNHRKKLLSHSQAEMLKNNRTSYLTVRSFGWRPNDWMEQSERNIVISFEKTIKWRTSRKNWFLSSGIQD
jgi:hypothetical protein